MCVSCCDRPPCCSSGRRRPSPCRGSKRPSEATSRTSSPHSRYLWVSERRAGSSWSFHPVCTDCWTPRDQFVILGDAKSAKYSHLAQELRDPLEEMTDAQKQEDKKKEERHSNADWWEDTCLKSLKNPPKITHTHTHTSSLCCQAGFFPFPQCPLAFISCPSLFPFLNGE